MEAATTIARLRTPGRRLREAASGAAYIVVTLPVGALCVALLLAAGLVGVILSPLRVGFAVLNATAAAAWRYAQLERAVANRLLAARIPPLPPRRRIDAPGWRKITASFRETGSRRAIRLALFKLPATLAGAAAALCAAGLAVALALLGIRGLTVPDPPIYVGGARLGIAT